MLVARIGTGVLVAAALSAFGGCQSVGPIAIDAGRDRYNSIIQSTSKQQAFENIIRVHNNEPTSFMDVTEVDATQTFTGTLSGSVTGIGSKPGTFGTLGSVTPGVSYSEAPLVRYVPLVGQGLVEQTVAPVNTDALASLYDSGWDVMPLLDFSTNFLTLDHDEYGAALNLIAELDRQDRLQLTSTKSDWTKNANAGGNGGQSVTSDANNGQTKKTPTASSTDDALVIYLLPYHPHSHRPSPDQPREKALWDQLAALYRGTQAPVPGPQQQQIELRTMPVTKTPRRFTYTAPLMRTFSAFGILKSAAQGPNPRIDFVSPGDYYKITHDYPWNDPDHNDSLLCVYTIAPEDLQKGDEEFEHTRFAASEDQRDEQWANKKLDGWLRENYAKQQADSGRLSLPYVYWRPGMSEDELVKVNYRLWQLRRYMLIIKSDAPPPADAYVAYFDRGFWYYIAGEDKISQKNFNLIALFMTVMAVPATNAPLTTSISIGGGG